MQTALELFFPSAVLETGSALNMFQLSNLNSIS